MQLWILYTLLVLVWIASLLLFRLMRLPKRAAVVITVATALMALINALAFSKDLFISSSLTAWFPLGAMVAGIFLGFRFHRAGLDMSYLLLMGGMGLCLYALLTDASDATVRFYTLNFLAVLCFVASFVAMVLRKKRGGLKGRLGN